MNNSFKVPYFYYLLAKGPNSPLKFSPKSIKPIGELVNSNIYCVVRWFPETT